MTQDHGQYDEDCYNPDEDPFDPSDPKYQPKEGGGGGQDFSIPPPASTYTAVIESWERKPPGASGYPYINLSVSIVGGDFDSRWIWDILSYSPKAAFRWAELFQALGWTPEHGAIDRNDDDQLAEWFDSGRTFKIRTKIESYRTTQDGRLVTKRSAKVKRFLAAEGEAQYVDRPASDGESSYEPAHQLTDEDPFGSQGGDGGGGGYDDDMPF